MEQLLYVFTPCKISNAVQPESKSLVVCFHPRNKTCLSTCALRHIM